MTLKRSLSNEERNFLSLVNRAIFVNPFSDERIEVDLKIARLSKAVSAEERVNKMMEEVIKRIKNIESESEGEVNIHHFSGEDHLLIKNAFLFEFYHRFIDRFNQLILDQIEVGDTPIKVSFAREATSLLQKRGFAEDEIHHFVALCYQLRRAYFFIDRNLVGRSPCMKELRKNLWNNVFTYDLELYNKYLWNKMEHFSTLILGETGTGKGTAASAIGRSGFIPFDPKKESFIESFTQSFVSLNLSQFPEALIESELFGHRKGAFTGAIENYNGIFSRCSSHGAIFLDEIGEVTIPVQIKLLQVLQDRVFSPVGSHQKERFQGRVIAATNRQINEIRDQYILRDDFFYRLCSDIIIVPPLRQRIREDSQELNELIHHTIKQMLGKSFSELVEMIRTIIKKKLGQNYLWPGNVRELEQCIRRILLKRTYEGDYKTTLTPDVQSYLIQGIQRSNLNAQDLLSAYCYLLYTRYGTFEEVAKKTNLDRRTAKRYIKGWIKEE